MLPTVLAFAACPLPAAVQFACPIDPRTGGSKDRTINIQVACDPDVANYTIDYAWESDM